MKSSNSSFWLDRTNHSVATMYMNDEQVSHYNLYQLAKSKRAISNFVSILTGKQIPVQFKTKGNSYTDGKSVVISSKLDTENDFDIACGLSLHEGSHILLSDFTILSDLSNRLRDMGVYSTLVDVSNKLGVPLLGSLKTIMNIIEDRRIDYFVYTTSPGYREYYKKMYDKYFNDPVIEKALKSDEFTTEEWESYEFRLINLHSKSTRLNSLRGLKEISDMIDLQNIGRIKDTNEVFTLSVQVLTKIFEYLLQNQQEESLTQKETDKNSESELSEVESSSTDSENGSEDEETETSQSQSKGGGESSGEETDGESKFSSSSDEDGESSELESTGEGDSSNDTDEEEKVELTPNQKKTIQSKINKQKRFLDGDIRKSSIKKSDNAQIEVIEKSQAEIVSIKPFDGSKVDVIFAKKLTRELIESSTFPLSRRYGVAGDKPIQEGIRLGMILGRKLQIRSESKTTNYSRQSRGKIDKRLISSIGTGNTDIFYYSQTDKYNSGNIHISVDASGSMNGSKWESAMTNVVAIAKAVDMIPNLEIQITFRTTTSDSPYVVVGYDSRVDKFRKIIDLFPHLSPTGLTPEGLVFQSILDFMVESNSTTDSIFLNLSDGAPYFWTNSLYYTGSDAGSHTFKQVEKLRKMGIKVISYFISSNSEATSEPVFDQSYGSSANYIDVRNMTQVSRTINKLFLEK